MRGLTLVELATLAAWLEFLCLRLLIRAGAVLPPSEAMSAIGNGMAFVGVAALNLALLLMLAALVEQAWQTTQRVSKYLFLALATLTLALFIVGANSPVYLMFAAFALFVLIDGWLAMYSHPANLIWFGLLLAAYFLLGYAVSAPVLQIDLLPRPTVLALAELFAVLAAISAPFFLHVRFDSRAAIIGIVGAIVLGGMWVGVAWLPPTMMIWILGFTGYLSAPVYILAFGLFLYALTGLVLRAETRRLAMGLALIALGGLRWDYPYYTLLALTGFLLLAQNATREEKPSAEHAPVRSGVSL